MWRKLLKSGFDDGGLDIRGLDIGDIGLDDFEFDSLGGLESMATGSHGYLQQLVTVMYSILL